MPARRKFIGQAVPGQEGDSLPRGAGLFAGDVALDMPLILHFLRSPMAQEGIEIGGVAEAAQMPGVHAVHLGTDVKTLGNLSVNPVLPLAHVPDFPILATDRVAAVGQPIAAILADTVEQAADAAERIEVDFTGPRRIDEQTVARQHWTTAGADAAFGKAVHVVRARVAHPVLAPSPMEPRTIAVRYHPDTGSVTVWHSTQTPHRSKSALAQILGIDPERLRVIAPDVGGAFGMKGSVYPEEILAVWAALHHRRDVRWVATRSEEFLSATHGRGLTSTGELAIDAEGRFLALRAAIEAPLGHWVPNSGLIPAWNAARVLPCGYDIAEIDVTTLARITPHPPRGIYRGAGRPEANALMERLVDEAAWLTGLDPVDLRRRNLLAPDRFPHDTATGNRLDSGGYAAVLDALAEKGGYAAALAARDVARSRGDLSGVGVAFYVEPSGEGWESARVTLHADRAEIASGSSAQGQWRKTAFAQIAAQALDLPISAVTVRYGDTETCPAGIGALASRSTPIGGSAVLVACREAMHRRDSGEALPITVETRYENDGQAWGYGAYLVCLTIDRDTGHVKLERITCVDDTGTVVNPELVRGQILGGIAQGLGEALMEDLRFDEDFQLLTGSFMDYAMPRATDIPPIAIHSLRTESPMNPLGAKGVGEAGTIGAPAAILNAALDALAPLGVTDLTMPLTPCKVWQAMQDASTGSGT
ncbi:xanthine dehydrogenase family protein molybdopterin-binding subunit [Sedimentitalea sp. JM2-8]|uniref:Xanthine dehydrogenase family protein molybdopterin-binding subunit n=1 Tax=Sedimentitalea xiamensis TaxID=3050037 RepID=A0ABT7FDW9_9RHOB|nr:xanthine dehydrogenase family protein molybdopterin-binding subunit [Sedimentitalea xiamensis]MDK3073019.1 xanthine dehydrogenase family protein molybdopterin-binding subunit [Sedimentitalea xiamensis]